MRERCQLCSAHRSQLGSVRSRRLLATRCASCLLESVAACYAKHGLQHRRNRELSSTVAPEARARVPLRRSDGCGPGPAPALQRGHVRPRPARAPASGRRGATWRIGPARAPMRLSEHVRVCAVVHCVSRGCVFLFRGCRRENEISGSDRDSATLPRGAPLHVHRYTGRIRRAVRPAATPAARR